MSKTDALVFISCKKYCWVGITQVLKDGVDAYIITKWARQVRGVAYCAHFFRANLSACFSIIQRGNSDKFFEYEPEIVSGRETAKTRNFFNRFAGVGK
mgnify:CR=1 FL=1